MQPARKLLKVGDLLLDPQNPRFYHLQLQGRTGLDQDQLQKEIEGDNDLIKLAKSIRRSGVKDPIWVREDGQGKYLVIEGNRRTVILRHLVADEVAPPEGEAFDEVLANVLPEDTPPTELLLQKARLQAGKKAWGPFNEAAVTHMLRTEHLLEYEDIGAELQLSMTEVKKKIENYKLFEEYARGTGDHNPKRFAYFNEAPKRVREWFLDSDENRATYFDLISPVSGRQKIRTVATKNGLRDFSKVLDDDEALDYLLNTPESTLEDALDIVKENDIMKGMPFIKRIEPMAQNLRGVSEDQLAKLQQEPKIRIAIKSLERACASLLEKIS